MFVERKGEGCTLNCDGLHLHCLDPHALRFDGQMGDEDFLLSNAPRQIHTQDHHVELAIEDMDLEVAISFVFSESETLKVVEIQGG